MLITFVPTVDLDLDFDLGLDLDLDLDFGHPPGIGVGFGRNFLGSGFKLRAKRNGGSQNPKKFVLMSNHTVFWSCNPQVPHEAFNDLDAGLLPPRGC